MNKIFEELIQNREMDSVAYGYKKKIVLHFRRQSQANAIALAEEKSEGCCIFY